jgi:hypothetical protein
MKAKADEAIDDPCCATREPDPCCVAHQHDPR